MSKGYYSFNKSQSCPVCESTSSKCRGRQDNGTEFILCMTFADALKGTIENGYKCIKAANPVYQHYSATFVLDSTGQYTEEQRREWLERKQARELAAKTVEAIQLTRSLSNDIRDSEYSKILESLSMDATTLGDLTKRGFTKEEIASCGFKSVTRYQRLPFSIDERLPGISAKGNSLIVSNDGYLCPLKDYDGNIVALQLRLNSDSDAGRYRWVSSEHQTLALKVGIATLENPLTVFKPAANPTGIALVEGTGAKPFLTTSRLNLITIGAAGGQFTGSPVLLREYLSRASTDCDNTKLVTIYPDAGDVANKQVMTRWEQVATLVQQLGYTVQFAWWNQVTKDAYDIDELTDYSQIKYLDAATFLTGKVEATTTTKKTVEDSNDAADFHFQCWVRARQFTPTIIINNPDFYFPDGLLIDDSIVAVKSGMGTGKTNAMLKAISESPNRAFILGSLNNLLLNTISRATGYGVSIYHLHEDDALNLVPDANTNIACCVDSMQHLDGYFKGVDLYIDEICSVISHILSGGTLGNRQAYIMTIFKKAIREANRVIILDANNNDIITNFISEIDPTKTVIKLENKAVNTRPHHFSIVNGFNPDKRKINKNDKSPLIKLATKTDIKPFIASDSRDFTNVIAEILEENGKRGYALNRDTVTDDKSKAFLANPDNFLAANNPDYYAISPTANSGVSITTTANFNTKITVFTGVLATNQQTQIMLRMRPHLEHYVFCAESSSFGVDERMATPISYKRTVLDRVALSNSISNVFSNESQAKITGNAISNSEHDIWFELSSKLGSLDIYERMNYRKCLIYALEEQGHTVEIINLDVSKESKEKFKETKDNLATKKAEQVYDAVPFDSIEEANQVAKSSPKPSEMRRVEKTRILDRLPDIDSTQSWTPDFIKQTVTDREFIAKYQRYWMLTHPDISNKKSEVNWFFNTTNDNFYIGAMDKDPNLKIWALRELGILELVDKLVNTNYAICKDSIEVVDIYDKALNNPDINLALGVHVSFPTVAGSERIRLLRQLLESIGVVLKSNGQKLINGKKQRIYLIDSEDYDSQIRQDILTTLDKKWGNYLESDTVKKVDWTNSIVEQPIEPIPVLEVETPITLEDAMIPLIIEQLEAITTKEDYIELVDSITDEQLQKSWQQLTLGDTTRIRQLVMA